jgi:predicted metal-dependent phosphotriesterase family hydrolase
VTAEVMTVLGPVPASQLGVTLPHEHVLCDLWRVTRDPNHFMTDVPLAIEEVGRFETAGGRSIVDCTSLNLGRDPRALEAVSRATGVNIVMGCGWYREPFYDRSIYERSVRQIAADIEREIAEGVGDTGIRPGIIGEIGTDLHYVSPAEERVFRAVARVQRRTGLSITTHTARCPVGLDQLDLLEDEGGDLRRVVIGHCDTYPDPEFHAAVARRGAYVQFDNIRPGSEWDTRNRIRWIRRLVDGGHIRQVLLSQDVYMKPLLAAYGGGSYDYLPTHFVPRLLEAGFSREQVQVLVVENPRAALTGER